MLALVDAGPAPERLEQTLRNAGHTLELARDAGAAELQLRRGGVDVAVVCASGLPLVRRVSPATPAAVWLGTASSDGVAAALAAGADEVLHEGMGSRELLARTEALARRVAAAPTAVSFGALTIDQHLGEATWAGERLALTRRERQLLHALASAGGTTIRREALYRDVWGYAMVRGDRTVDVNVRRLRAKLAGVSNLRIVTEPSVGYRLEGDAVTKL